MITGHTKVADLGGLINGGPTLTAPYANNGNTLFILVNGANGITSVTFNGINVPLYQTVTELPGGTVLDAIYCLDNAPLVTANVVVTFSSSGIFCAVGAYSSSGASATSSPYDTAGNSDPTSETSFTKSYSTAPYNNAIGVAFIITSGTEVPTVDAPFTALQSLATFGNSVIVDTGVIATAGTVTLTSHTANLTNMTQVYAALRPNPDAAAGLNASGGFSIRSTGISFFEPIPFAVAGGLSVITRFRYRTNPARLGGAGSLVAVTAFRYRTNPARLGGAGNLTVHETYQKFGVTQWTDQATFGGSGSLVSYDPILYLVVQPPNPSIPSSTPGGTTVATLTGIRTDGRVFAGNYVFRAPNYSAGGAYEISQSTFGSSGFLKVAENGPGVGSAGGTIEDVTIVAADPPEQDIAAYAPGGGFAVLETVHHAHVPQQYPIQQPLTGAGNFVAYDPLLLLVVNPPSLTISSSQAVDTSIATLTGVRTDGRAFGGNFVFRAPNYSSGGTYAIMQSAFGQVGNLVVAGHGPGVGSAGGTLEDVTIVAADPPEPDIAAYGAAGSILGSPAVVFKETGSFLGSTAFSGTVSLLHPSLYATFSAVCSAGSLTVAVEISDLGSFAGATAFSSVITARFSDVGSFAAVAGFTAIAPTGLVLADAASFAPAGSLVAPPPILEAGTGTVLAASGSAAATTSLAVLGSSSFPAVCGSAVQEYYLPAGFFLAAGFFSSGAVLGSPVLDLLLGQATPIFGSGALMVTPSFIYANNPVALGGAGGVLAQTPVDVLAKALLSGAGSSLAQTPINVQSNASFVGLATFSATDVLAISISAPGFTAAGSIVARSSIIEVTAGTLAASGAFTGQPVLAIPLTAISFAVINNGLGANAVTGGLNPASFLGAGTISAATPILEAGTGTSLAAAGGVNVLGPAQWLAITSALLTVDGGFTGTPVSVFTDAAVFAGYSELDSVVVSTEPVQAAFVAGGLITVANLPELARVTQVFAGAGSVAVQTPVTVAPRIALTSAGSVAAQTPITWNETASFGAVGTSHVYELQQHPGTNFIYAFLGGAGSFIVREPLPLLLGEITTLGAAGSLLAQTSFSYGVDQATFAGSGTIVAAPVPINMQTGTVFLAVGTVAAQTPLAVQALSSLTATAASAVLEFYLPAGHFLLDAGSFVGSGALNQARFHLALGETQLLSASGTLAATPGFFSYATNPAVFVGSAALAVTEPLLVYRPALASFGAVGSFSFGLSQFLAAVSESFTASGVFSGFYSSTGYAVNPGVFVARGELDSKVVSLAQTGSNFAGVLNFSCRELVRHAPRLIIFLSDEISIAA